jgi:inner membrane protein
MDPISQGILGLAVSQSLLQAKIRYYALFTLVAFLTAMSPDLDIFLTSAVDPLFGLEWHRQFTHSLVWIPCGALLCAVFFYVLFAKRKGCGFIPLYCCCLLAYATHGFLDACTAYGTQLFWPFSHDRVAWNIISIIDPLLTVPAIIMMILAGVCGQRRWAWCALCWLAGYLLLGYWQHQRAVAWVNDQALHHQHVPEAVFVAPSFANLVVWRTIYLQQGVYHVAALRLLSSRQRLAGNHIMALNTARDFPALGAHSVQRHDIRRFRWFALGYLAVSPGYPGQIIDLRYSALPQSTAPLWSILINPKTPQRHVRFVYHRKARRQQLCVLWHMVWDGVLRVC